MGTEVEPKMYLPGYYTLRDLDDSAGNGSWSVHNESRTSKNGQYYDIFLTSPAMDGYPGYDKEQLKQTILKHEYIFKHQLRELHRLYKRQRDLMNEIKCKEQHEHPIPTGASLSSLLSSRISSEDARIMWHNPNFLSVDSPCVRPSTYGTDSNQSPLSIIKGKIMQSGHVPTQNGVTLKDHNSFEFKCKKVQRRLFGLELPAAKDMDNEEERLEERVSRVLGVEDCPPNMNYEVTRKREINLSLSSGMNSGCNGHASSPNLCVRNHGLADLNEPILVEEASSTTVSVDILGNTTCLKGEIRRQDSFLNSNSGFQCLGKEFSQNPPKGRVGRVGLNNLHSEKERNPKEWLSSNSGDEQSGGGKDSFHGGVCPEDLPTPFKSLRVEPRNDREPLTSLPSDQGKAEPRRTRTIFGVEFSERNHDQNVAASLVPALHPLVPHSFHSSSISSWSKLPNKSSQNLVSVQEHSGLDNSASLNKISKTLLHSPELVGERLHDNRNSSSIPRFSVEAYCENGFCLGSQMESKEQVRCPSGSFDYLIGITDNKSPSEQFVQHGPLKYCKVSGCADVESAKDMNVDLVPPYKFQNEVTSRQNSVSVNGQRKYEKPLGDLPWLIKPICAGESSKLKEGSNLMKLDSSQNSSQLFANKTEMGRGLSEGFILDSISAPCAHDGEQKKIEVVDSPTIRKILGVPIFEMLHNSKDLSSFSCPSKPSCLTSSIDIDNTGKAGLPNTDLPCDLLSLDSGVQLKVESLVVERGLDNCSAGFRHQIDLNLCLFEEEAQSVPSCPTAIVKIAAEIDLEAPIVLETEKVCSPQGESLENQLKKPSESLRDESGELHGGLIRVAAEAIIAISSCHMHDRLNDATCCPSEAPQSDSLHWFAEVISSYDCDLENEVGAASMVKDGASHEEFIPNGIDFFEFMTLKLTETNVEESYCKPESLENQKDEETLPKRPRRGQARRGRQRKDFQRDILPGLVSLSRHEVTEDLQAFEGMIRATGGIWQSSLSKRNTAKNSLGRGRRRPGNSVPAPTVSAVCPPPIQEQANYRELGLEETSLTGWGKRTRRPPRHRCPISNHPPLLK